MQIQKILVYDNNPEACEILIVVRSKEKMEDNDVISKVKDVLNKASEGYNTLIYEGLIINLNNKTVIIDGTKTEFTKTEFDLLVFLVKNKGKIFSRSELVTAVWPDNVVVTNRTVDVNMTRIRKKIGAYSANIVARAGFGYMFGEE